MTHLLGRRPLQLARLRASGSAPDTLRRRGWRAHRTKSRLRQSKFQRQQSPEEQTEVIERPSPPAAALLRDRFHDRLSTDIGGRARPAVDDKLLAEAL